MDTSKPVGDACREDGTLKDAGEMEWPDSPTGYNQSLLSQRSPFDDNGSELEWPISPSEHNEASSELGNRKRKRLA